MKTSGWLQFAGGFGLGLALVACRGEPETSFGSAEEPLTWGQEDKLLPIDGVAEESFGTLVALGGDTALVGAYREASYRGAAHVFVRSGAAWSPQQKLTASDGETPDQFGVSAAVSGDTVLVGAPGKASYQGTTYVFDRAGSSWSPQQILTAGDGAKFDLFGGSVAMSGETALIGAEGKTGNQGGAYVFVRSGSSWSPQEILTAGDGAPNDLFGRSVALSGESALVGARGKDSDRGGAYVFDRSGAAWSPQQKLTANDGELGDQFGAAVAMSGDTALVGAPGSAADRGAAYVFVRSGAAWSPQQKLTANPGHTGDLFGASVALNGSLALVGARGKAAKRGAVYVFARSGASWYPEGGLAAKDGVAGDGLGGSVAMSEDTVIVGTFHEGPSVGGGAAYVFSHRLSDGASCAEEAQCASHHCTDGVCCEVAACPASDACHEGVCQPGTGICSNRAKADGAPCDSGTCQSGVCEGSTTTETGGDSRTGAGEPAGETGVMDLSCRSGAASTGHARAAWVGLLALLALLGRRRSLDLV